jgi:hypothetical protein
MLCKWSVIYWEGRSEFISVSDRRGWRTVTSPYRMFQNKPFYNDRVLNFMISMQVLKCTATFVLYNWNLEYFCTFDKSCWLWGRVVAQTVGRLSLTAGTQVRFMVSPCELYGGWSDTGTGLLQVPRLSPVGIIPQIFRIHPFVCHRRDMIWSQQTASSSNTKR